VAGLENGAALRETGKALLESCGGDAVINTRGTVWKVMRDLGACTPDNVQYICLLDGALI